MHSTYTELPCSFLQHCPIKMHIYHKSEQYLVQKNIHIFIFKVHWVEGHPLEHLYNVKFQVAMAVNTNYIMQCVNVQFENRVPDLTLCS
jgi:hypothetical protein